MRNADNKLVFVVVGIAAILFLFYFLVLGPKRKEASSLSEDITKLESQVDQQKTLTQFAEDARENFPQYYSRLVVLGKAVPEVADSASMLVEVNSVASRAGTDFRGFELSDGAGTAAGEGSTAGTAPPPTESGSESSGGTPPSESAPSGDASSTPASTAAAPAPATEATAANLPIGAVVGPAGLPTLPYAVTMTGGFFGVTNFIGGLDNLVNVRSGNGQVSANGRLLTVDGFAMHDPALVNGQYQLAVDFSLTSYVTPPDQGLTAGATPGGPAPAPAAPAATPASSTVAP